MTKSSTRKTAARKPIIQAPTLHKLNDAQRIILWSAAQREDSAAALPASMTERAAQKLGAVLVEKGLAREIRAKAGMPVWRRNEAGRACALIITKLGREAIKGDDDRQTVDADLDAPAPPSIATEARSQTAAPSRPERTIPRQGSKLAEVMTLLGRKQGADIEELTSATGWLPHTTRAALTGLRKRGFAIERSRSDQGASVYRIVMGATPALAA
jgi:hypothetical protein